MIAFQHLTKRYGSLTAVDDLSFVANPGKITGFLGPNGAGKTTTLRVSTGLVRANSGQTLFDGKPYSKLNKPARRVGMVLEPTVFHPGRTALDHLMMLASYSGVGKKRCHQMLSLVGLDSVAKKRVGQFSLGMRGRLNLAASLLGDPGTLLLDEPTNGLDPEGIKWVRELLRKLADEGRTILISSHLLSEIQQMVDEVVIITQGKLVFSGSLSELETSSNPVLMVESTNVDAVRYLAQSRGWTLRDEPGHTNVVMIEGPKPEEVSKAVIMAGIPLTGLTVQTSDLESVFFALTEGKETKR